MVEGKQLKCGGSGGGGVRVRVRVRGETIEMWWWWWWWLWKKTMAFYGLKTYINAQNSTSFSVYILLFRS